MSNPRRDLARLRTRKRTPDANDELPAASHTSPPAEVVNLQRFVGNRGMQSMIAQRRLLGTQIPGGNRSHSLAIQRSSDANNADKEDDKLRLSQTSLAQTIAPSVQREDGLEEPMVSEDGSHIEFPMQHVDTGGNSSGATVSEDGSHIEFPMQHVDTGGNSSGATVSEDGSHIEFPPQHVDTGDASGNRSGATVSDDGGFIEFPPQVIDEW
jgi:hypothetical protein